MSSAPQVTPQTPSKPLKGKYDGRGKYDRRSSAFASGIKPGPKPLYRQHIAKNSYAKLLSELDSIASWSQIYAEAWAKRQLALCIQMREYADSRLLGKPYTAENPNAAKTPSVLNQDNRLQIAIQQLLPQKQPAKGKRKSAKLLEGNVVTQEPVLAEVVEGAE